MIRPKFQHSEHSRKLRCIVCGRTGWDTRGWPEGLWKKSWMYKCSLGHRYPCRLGCGRRFATKQGLGSHERPRRCTHHHIEVPT